MGERDGGTSFLVGLVLGAVIGLAVGFLYAPRPGIETRGILKERTVKAKERAAEVMGKVKEAVSNAAKMT